MVQVSSWSIRECYAAVAFLSTVQSVVLSLVSKFRVGSNVPFLHRCGRGPVQLLLPLPLLLRGGDGGDDLAVGLQLGPEVIEGEGLGLLAAVLARRHSKLLEVAVVFAGPGKGESKIGQFERLDV